MSRCVETITGFWLLCFLQTIYAGEPIARITGPREMPVGDLCVLDASQSSGCTGFLWLLANSEKSFLPVDGGIKCVFASGTPGRFLFVLIVAGVNNNGAPVAAMTKHELTITGGVPPPVPPPIPPPVPPPVPGKRIITILRESASVTPDLANLQLAMQANESLKQHRVTWIDPDSKDQDGNPSARVAVIKSALGSSSLPGIVVEDELGAVLFAGTLPGTLDEVLALVRKHGG